MPSDSTLSLSSSALLAYAQAGLYGMGRGLAGFPIEHPFEVIKTQTQIGYGRDPTLQIVKKIYKEEGARGYYRGAVPNAIRKSIKPLYQWPMMVAGPHFFASRLPKNVHEKFPSLPPFLTGVSLATLESLVICPLEKRKVDRITSRIASNEVPKTNEVSISRKVKGAYLGLNALLPRQLTSWVTFMVADSVFKRRERERIQADSLPFSSLIKVSLEVGSVNTLANMPFDVAKTHLQRHNFSGDTHLFSILRDLYRQNGIVAMYAGWRVRLVQYMIQSLVTVSLLDKLQNSWKKSS